MLQKHPSSKMVMSGVLQSEAKGASLPAGASVTITARVVGRNTKGPLAVKTVGPLDAPLPLPSSFSLRRVDLREGVPDFLWAAEDIYVRTEVTKGGKTLLDGRSKAKFKDEQHQTAYVTLE